MTDTEELEIAIKRARITKRAIAKQLGISETALYNKINGDAEFKASEILKMKKILNLSDEQRDNIFFHIK